MTIVDEYYKKEFSALEEDQRDFDEWQREFSVSLDHIALEAVKLNSEYITLNEEGFKDAFENVIDTLGTITNKALEKLSKVKNMFTYGDRPLDKMEFDVSLVNQLLSMKDLDKTYANERNTMVMAPHGSKGYVLPYLEANYQLFKQVANVNLMIDQLRKDMGALVYNDNALKDINSLNYNFYKKAEVEMDKRLKVFSQLRTKDDFGQERPFSKLYRNYRELRTTSDLAVKTVTEMNVFDLIQVSDNAQTIKEYVPKIKEKIANGYSKKLLSNLADATLVVARTLEIFAMTLHVQRTINASLEHTAKTLVESIKYKA